jgi:hypothetical protein
MLAACTGVIGVASWYGCAIYDPSLLVAADAGDDGDDGGVAEAGEEAEAAPNPCPELTPPPPPTVEDPSDAGDQSFVAALHTINVGLDPDAGPALLGYDLDHVYTCCDGGPESCKPIVTGAQHCDTAEGRDNSGGLLLASLAGLDSQQFNANTISQRLQQGVYSILVQILHYNGTANDKKVTAAIYGSGGIYGADGGPALAQWNGQDPWTVDSDFVLSGDGGAGSPILPSHFDPNAYVSGGVLVMAVDFPLSLGASGTGSLTVSLTGAHITASVAPAGGGAYAFTNGQIAGRWATSQLLSALQSLNIGPNPVCRGTSIYNQVKQLICQAADVTGDPTLDNKGATCDALSIGFGFTADPALLGAVTPPSTKLSPCGGGGDAGDGGAPEAAPDNCP